MAPEIPGLGSRFIISSLPRSGSTTIASLLNCHPQVRCILEPFNPNRYQGIFYNEALRSRSVETTVNAIWNKWNCIKHVWQSDGWPFETMPWLNEQLARQPRIKFIVIVRRNLLKRFISNYLCRAADYWIGSKQEFLYRLERTALPYLNPLHVKHGLTQDYAAMSHHLRQVKRLCPKVKILFYEDFFGPETNDETRISNLSELFTFLSLSVIEKEYYLRDYHSYFDMSIHRWCSREIYQAIPNIRQIEELAGSDQTGWLFR
jgi:hypothetical protein